MMKRTIAGIAMAAGLVLGSAGVAGAAHQHVDNPSGCHDTASRAGENSESSNWNKNAKNQANDNSPVISSGTC